MTGDYDQPNDTRQDSKSMYTHTAPPVPRGPNDETEEGPTVPAKKYYNILSTLFKQTIKKQKRPSS